MEDGKNYLLGDDELGSVTGGTDTSVGGVMLIGPYYADSYGNREQTRTIGWGGLTVGRILQDRPAPVEIRRSGTTIGWAPRESVIIPGA